MTADTMSEAAVARELLTGSGSATLATLENGGGPFASYVITAPAADGSPLLLLSRLAVHTHNIARDPRASLLFVEVPAPGSAMLTASRLTITGRALPDADPESRERFLARHPEATQYAGFGDFSFYRFHIEAGHLVAGFGRIVSFPRDALLTETG